MDHDRQASANGSAIGAGIVYMCMGAICMVALDVAVRSLLETYELVQVIFLRSVFAFVLIALIIVQQRQVSALRTRRPGWHVFRSLLMTGSIFTFFYALKYLPLADVIVLAFAAPLIITAMSRPFLGESVGPWRWAAVIAGFVGVLIVVRPGYGVVHPAAFVALAGAAFYSGLALTARKLANTESVWSMSLYSFIAPTLIGGVASVGSWTMPDSVDWIVFALSGTFGALAFLCVNAAYARAPATIIVPFEYTGLIWATAAGYLFWDEVPGLNTWLGAAIIVASGMLILFRETIARPKADAGLDFPLQEVTGVKVTRPAGYNN
jgi:drug/metabolite transporter (DMT)-like permease